MSPEKQRIAIAEACGWKWIDHPDTLAATKSFTLPGKWVINPLRKLDSPHYAPDYLNDLNAMHEAEKVLTWDQQKVFISHLMGLEGRSGDALWSLAWDTAWLCSHATAAQRAEAFLRTIGKWEESTKETTK